MLEQLQVWVEHVDRNMAGSCSYKNKLHFLFYTGGITGTGSLVVYHIHCIKKEIAIAQNQNKRLNKAV